MQSNYTYYDYFNPVDHLNVTKEEMRDSEYARYYVFTECLRQISLSDCVVIRYSDNQVTWGTPVEQFYCWMNGVPNVVYTDVDVEELPGFMRVMADGIESEEKKVLRALEELSW